MQVVPQYIDIEDKIVGPLTWKHIGWLFGGTGILVIAWLFLDKLTFYIFAVPIGIIIGLLAFYRPNGVSMIEFIGYSLGYVFRPKLYTWQREVEKVKKKKKEDVVIKTSSEEEKVTVDDIAAMAQTLDSRGVERNERIKEIMRQQSNKNK